MTVLSGVGAPTGGCNLSVCPPCSLVLALGWAEPASCRASCQQGVCGALCSVQSVLRHCWGEFAGCHTHMTAHTCMLMVDTPLVHTHRCGCIYEPIHACIHGLSEHLQGKMKPRTPLTFASWLTDEEGRVGAWTSALGGGRQWVWDYLVR